MAGWKSDLSYGHGQNSFDYTVRNTLNTSFGPQSQSTFDAGGLRYAQDIVNLDFSKEFAIGAAKPLAVAAGGEYRHENFQIRPGDNQSWQTGPFFRPSITTTAANCTTQQGVFNAATGVCSFPGRAAPAGAQGFPGIPASSATDVGRHSWAAYVELDTDPIEGVTTTIAGRYEHFSDFGSTWNGKFAARWEPVDGFALRGSVSNGFRAPSLHQQFFTTTSTNFIAGLPVDISTLAVNSPVALALGSKPLEPEKSFNVSLGATANPLAGLTITADLYQIKIDDRIVLTENLGAAGSGTAAQNAAVKAILDANGFQSVGAARFFINGLDTTTRGIDVVAVYRTRMAGFGNWSLSAAYNYNKTKIDERLNALGPLATIPGLVLFGRVEGIRFTHGQPRDKIVLQRRRRHRQVRDHRPDHPLRQGRLAGRGGADRRPDQPHRLRPGRHLPQGQVDHRPRVALQGVRRARAGGRRQQPLRRLPDPLALRRPAGVDRRSLSGQPGIYPLLDLLALRLQRPLPLRTRLGRLLDAPEIPPRHLPGRNSRATTLSFRPG